MASPSLIPAGDFRTTYAADTTIFPTTSSRNAAIIGIVLICFAPLVFTGYWLSILIQIGIFAIAALGLNILVGSPGRSRLATPRSFCSARSPRPTSPTIFLFRCFLPFRSQVSSPRWLD